MTVAAIALVGAVGGCGGPSALLDAAGPPVSVRPPRAAVPAAALGRPTRSSPCRARGLLPDPDCTPGAVFATVTVGRICTPGYASSVRDVPEGLKRRVYADYGIASHIPGSYEVDHLVPLELGGTNAIANLWPESSPGYHEKDAVENELHDAVCAGRVALRVAQRQIARDWRRTAVTAGG